LSSFRLSLTSVVAFFPMMPRYEIYGIMVFIWYESLGYRHPEAFEKTRHRYGGE